MASVVAPSALFWQQPLLEWRAQQAQRLGARRFWRVVVIRRRRRVASGCACGRQGASCAGRASGLACVLHRWRRCSSNNRQDQVLASDIWSHGARARPCAPPARAAYAAVPRRAQARGVGCIRHVGRSAF